MNLTYKQTLFLSVTKIFPLKNKSVEKQVFYFVFFFKEVITIKEGEIYFIKNMFSNTFIKSIIYIY